MAISVGGFTAFSTTDYPGSFSAVIFCQGCPWRCRYCHNPHLIPSKKTSQISWESIYSFLKGRRNLLDAVVFSGGEPSLQSDLIAAIKLVRQLGFRVGLHTSGACSKALTHLLPLLDWVGFDIKATIGGYKAVTQVPSSGNTAWKSLEAVLQSNINCEVRSTIHPSLLARTEIIQIAKTLSSMGVKKYVLQEFRETGCKDLELNAAHSRNYLDQDLVSELTRLFPSFEVRRA